jgi:hypothetical protein
LPFSAEGEEPALDKSEGFACSRKDTIKTRARRVLGGKTRILGKISEKLYFLVDGFYKCSRILLLL